MNPLPAPLIAAAGLGGQVTGFLAQGLALLLGVAVAWIALNVVWNLLKELAKSPSIEKLLGIVAVGMFAAFLVAAAPALLDTAYAYGASFVGGP
ncbi:MAG: hypothetical protein AAGD35_16065 [Actinomycetota bacterium]